MTKIHYVAAVDGEVPDRTACGLVARDGMALSFDTPDSPKVSESTRRSFLCFYEHQLCRRCRLSISGGC